MTIMYGTANCDTVKKARAWLDIRRVPFTFHDYKKAGVDAALLQGWVHELGWEALLNRSGTTFRKLDAADKADIDDAKAVQLMLAHPSAIKRPVLVTGDEIVAGFVPDRYQALFGE